MVGYVHKKYESHQEEIEKIVSSFDERGNQIKDARNKLKLFDLKGQTVNIKSFKVPNRINKLVYKFFRKGKAQRSFEYASKLIEMGIGSPQPIAYYKEESILFLKKSFYVSEHLDYDLTYRELIHDFNYPDWENILRAFTRFTFKLHEKGVYFLDHSPGNTLIKRKEQDYEFYLVDLNRMKFKSLTYNERIKNFDRLSKHENMVRIMSDEYAKCINKNPNAVFDLMWKYTNQFRTKIRRKKNLKKKFK